MCLSRPKPLNTSKGYGYQCFVVRLDGKLTSLFAFTAYSRATRKDGIPVGKWERDPADPKHRIPFSQGGYGVLKRIARSYERGFHIFLSLEQARSYLRYQFPLGRVVLRKVWFRDVTTTGLLDSHERKVVVVKERRVSTRNTKI